MRIHNLYVDADGETHFRDIEIEWKHEGRGGKTSATLPATGIIFRETPGTYDYEWHPAPRRQYIINLDAGVLAVTAPGAYSVEILSAKKDIQGNRKSIANHFGAEVQDTLPAGDYVLLVKFEGDVAPKEVNATVKAGDYLIKVYGKNDASSTTPYKVAVTLVTKKA